MIAKIQNENWLGFDACITTPDMMGLVGRIARVLGPKGLMPNPKSGTVTTDVVKAINDVKAGKVEYRLDKNNIVHVIIGKKSFGKEKLVENLNTVMDAIVSSGLFVIIAPFVVFHGFIPLIAFYGNLVIEVCSFVMFTVDTAG